MKSILVFAATRRILSQVEIRLQLREVIPGDVSRRESVISELLGCCVFRPGSDASAAREAMRFFYWYELEQYDLNRISADDFYDSALPIFVRFCEGAPRDMTDEDQKICKLINTTLYSPTRDPLAQVLKK